MAFLRLKWSVSRGRDTYGYNIASLYEQGVKVSSTCGGGYDMVGTVLGAYITNHYQAELKELVKNSERQDYARIITKNGVLLYGLYETSKGTPYIEGACGLSSVKEIANALGLTVQEEYEKRRGHKFPILVGFFI